MSFSFSFLVSFIAIIQILQCAFLIFHVFTFSHQIPSHTVFVSYFPRFSVFFPQSSSYSVYFSYLKFFTVSYHIPCPKVCFSFHTFFSVSCHISCPTMWFSPFPRFSVVSFLAIFKVLQCVCLILNLFLFPRHHPGPTVDISHFLLFSVFLAILHVIQCLFLIFQFLLFSRHNPGPKVFISHI